MMDPRHDRAIGSLVGLAIGDALGASLKGMRRDQRPPLQDLIGGGPLGLPAGAWTDDTAMALALAESLKAQAEFSPQDFMERLRAWWREGAYSATGTAIDVNPIVRAALERFEASGDPLAGSEKPATAGSGAISRLAPIAIRWHGAPERAAQFARLQSRTTHAAAACLDAAELLARVMSAAIAGAGKAAMLQPARPGWLAEIIHIAAGRWRDKQRGQIRTSGYVVDTLEAAFWCVARSEDPRSAVLMAANLAGEADAVAAVAGQLAGSIWGASAFPPAWREKIIDHERMEALASELCDLAK